MIEPVLVDHAQLTPGVCGFCRTHEGPFVDTRNTLVPNARYLCVKTCASQVARLAGFVSPSEVVERDELIETQQQHIRVVEAQLEVAGSDVDRLGDVIGAKVYDFLKEKEERRPEQVPA